MFFFCRSRVILTQNSLKTFLEGIFIMGTLNVNNYAVVNYSSSVDHMTESSSNGDLFDTDVNKLASLKKKPGEVSITIFK